MNNWQEKTSPYLVGTKLPRCAAKNFYEPDIKKVLTKITCEDDFFNPKNNSINNYVILYNNYPFDRSIVLRHFTTETIDCGFSIKIQSGYRVGFSLDQTWSDRGVIVSGYNYIDCEKECVFKFNIVNISEYMITINHKDKIGKMWIEPVYKFDWE